jgi:hypothetical protein
MKFESYSDNHDFSAGVGSEYWSCVGAGFQKLDPKGELWAGDQFCCGAIVDIDESLKLLFFAVLFCEYSGKSPAGCDGYWVGCENVDGPIV